jgi:hypothetical protein
MYVPVGIFEYDCAFRDFIFFNFSAFRRGVDWPINVQVFLLAAVFPLAPITYYRISSIVVAFVIAIAITGLEWLLITNDGRKMAIGAIHMFSKRSWEKPVCARHEV